MKTIVLLLTLLLISQNTFAVSLKPKEVVEQIFVQARNPKLTSDVKLQKELSKRINFDEMAIGSLGSYKKSLTAKQFSWFSTTLEKIITETVYPEAPGFFKNVKVSYEDEEVKNSKAKILSVVIEKGEETEVAYSLKFIKGEWKVVDVSLDDESWIESINEDVKVVMKKEKWAGLKKKLENRLRDIRKDKK